MVFFKKRQEVCGDNVVMTDHKKQNTVALKVSHIDKSFRLPTEQANGIKQAVINYFKGVKGYKQQRVLKNISFTVEKGDFFGIVGRNGSGKSTLLKLISQIYQPDSGEVTINGKLVPFIELGVGFNPELTGRENIYLNGALLGFSAKEVDAIYDEIVSFAELDQFMDQKLKNYSSGMQVRLAFSIAIKADADILVLDEVLAVGDEAFQRKCFQYFAELKKNKKTVILVTHSMDHVVKFCNKAMLIDKGYKTTIGKPGEIAQIYRSLNMQDSVEPKKRTKVKPKDTTIGTKKQDITISMDYQHRDQQLRFETTIEAKDDIPDPVFTFVIQKDTGEPVYRWVTDEKLSSKFILVKQRPVTIRLTLQDVFPDGKFSVQAGIKKSDRTEDYLLVNDCVTFEIINKNSPHPYDNLWKPREDFSVETDK